MLRRGREGPRVRRAEAILPTANLARAAAFLAQLGLTVERWEGGGFGFVRLGDAELWLLDERRDHDPATNAAALFLHVDDVDAWHARVTAAGIAATDVERKAWGMREFQLRDPDGNLLRLGSDA